MIHLEFTVEGRPVSHQTATRRRVADWKATVRAVADSLWSGDPLTGQLKFTLICFHERTEPPMDDDNMLKPIRDALNRLVDVDDSQIRHSETILHPIGEMFYVRYAPQPILDALGIGVEFVYVRIEDAETLRFPPRVPSVKEPS